MHDSVDLAFGSGGPVPLAVSYRQGEDTETLYISDLSDGFAGHVSVDNARWLEALDRMVAGKATERVQNGRHRRYVAW
jgi:hypothetical protein